MFLHHNQRNMKEIDRIVTLLKQYMGGEISPDSNPELQRLFEQYPVLIEIMQEVNDEDSLRKSLSSYILYTEKELLQLEDNIIEQINPKNDAIAPSIQTASSTKRLWKPFLRIAAACIFIFIAGYWLWDTPTEDTYENEALAFSPGSNRATLTFSDGNTIALEEHTSGIKINNDIAYQDGTPILSQQLDKIKDKTMLLTTPRGGQYFVELSDGTKVWLNAESSLQYPAQFSGATRDVKLIGEAYFEVKSNAKNPFIVTTNTEKVEVLGTHFNINSYQDIDFSAVTLREGKVKVAPLNNYAATRTLIPNKQAIIRGNEIEEMSVNAEEYIAWKNGEFMFNNESLASVLQKLSRWYDFDYFITPSLADRKIWGSISKYESFDKVLRIIKITDKKIKLNIKGKKVIIMEEN